MDASRNARGQDELTPCRPFLRPILPLPIQFATSRLPSFFQSQRQQTSVAVLHPAYECSHFVGCGPWWSSQEDASSLCKGLPVRRPGTESGLCLPRSDRCATTGNERCNPPCSKPFVQPHPVR